MSHLGIYHEAFLRHKLGHHVVGYIRMSYYYFLIVAVYCVIA